MYIQLFRQTIILLNACLVFRHGDATHLATRVVVDNHEYGGGVLCGQGLQFCADLSPQYS